MPYKPQFDAARMPVDPDAPNLLHVYAQQYPHDNVLLAGTRDAFARLRDALTAYLDPAHPDHWRIPWFYTNDGEGFDVVFVPHKPGETLRRPYTCENEET